MMKLGGDTKDEPLSGDEAGRVEDEDEEMEAEYVIEMEDAIQQHQSNQSGELNGNL
jgi:hypothetical protein